MMLVLYVFFNCHNEEEWKMRKFLEKYFSDIYNFKNSTSIENYDVGTYDDIFDEINDMGALSRWGDQLF